MGNEEEVPQEGANDAKSTYKSYKSVHESSLKRDFFEFGQGVCGHGFS